MFAFFSFFHFLCAWSDCGDESSCSITDRLLKSSLHYLTLLVLPFSPLLCSLLSGLDDSSNMVPLSVRGTKRDLLGFASISFRHYHSIANTTFIGSFLRLYFSGFLPQVLYLFFPFLFILFTPGGALVPSLSLRSYSGGSSCSGFFIPSCQNL